MNLNRGGLPQGRSKKYGRYWCRKQGCRAVKLPKDQLETEFLALLRCLRPHADALSKFPKIAAKGVGRKAGRYREGI